MKARILFVNDIVIKNDVLLTMLSTVKWFFKLITFIYWFEMNSVSNARIILDVFVIVI